MAKAKARAASKAVSFAFSTSGLTAEIQKTSDLARHVKQSLHADATPDERKRIDNIVKALSVVRQAAINVYCPNPYYGFYTVDETAIKSWRPAGAKAAKKAKKK